MFIFVIEAMKCPDTWDPPDPSDPYRRTQLSADNSEYKEVVQNVMKTAGTSVKQVVKVHARQLVYQIPQLLDLINDDNDDDDGGSLLPRAFKYQILD